MMVVIERAKQNRLQFAVLIAFEAGRESGHFPGACAAKGLDFCVSMKNQLLYKNWTELR
jgi:hypothetical protein